MKLIDALSGRGELAEVVPIFKDANGERTTEPPARIVLARTMDFRPYGDNDRSVFYLPSDIGRDVSVNERIGRFLFDHLGNGTHEPVIKDAGNDFVRTRASD